MSMTQLGAGGHYQMGDNSLLSTIPMNQNQNGPVLKIYVTMRKDYESDIDYKRLTLMIESNARIADLKRKIEKEFTDLFPNEPPFVTAKLEDEYGYSLSNSSRVGDFLKYGDRVVAQPELLLDPSRRQQDPSGQLNLHGGSNTEELIIMLKNLQQTIVNKIAMSQIQEYPNTVQLLELIIPLGFNPNKQVIHNICLILSRAIDFQNVRLFDDPINRNLLELILLMVQLWITDYVEQDSFILGSVVELIEILIHSAQFWATFKTMPVTARLLNMSKRPSINAFVKTKIISIVTAISKPSHNMVRPPSPSQQRNVAMNMRQNQTEESKMGGTSLSYELDTAYRNPQSFQMPQQQDTSAMRQQTGINKSYNDRLTQSRDRTRIILPYQNYDPHQPVVSQTFNRIIDQQNNMEIQQRRPPSNDTYNRPIDQLQARSNFQDPSVFDRHQNMTDKISVPLNDSLIGDYCQMLTPENTKEIQCFALQSLDPMIDDVIRRIMGSTDLLMSVFAIIDYLNFPFEIQQSQFKILQKIADTMNEARAMDIIKRNGLSRLINVFTKHNPRFQPVISHLIQKIVQHGKKNFDVKSLFALTQTSLPNIQELGIKSLVQLSENKEESKVNQEYLRSIDAEFENFIPHLIDMSKNQQKYSDDMRLSALQVLANLSLRDYLRPQIFSHKGMELFLEHIRKINPSMQTLQQNEAMRVAAKGLVNLVSNRRDLRLQVVAELTDEIKKIYRNELDPIVAAYIQTLLHQTPS
ncbi:UNKNOWN [Stylonychia lemnae]|uniref:Nucleolar protein Dnt1-like N-terminal domain-containing protein n=1 Tax=Stylonychia lemnae TaxID=5949 RepID=A0A078A9F8_STYLE|nr:UNKNOWN [Stylonychia lemnae]|eukprot:CDW78890.1 UNKNOWN [Stylonychia lemnae]